MIDWFSKEDIYTSKVKYIIKRGRPYLWVPEKELHNVVWLLSVLLFCFSFFILLLLFFHKYTFFMFKSMFNWQSWIFLDKYLAKCLDSIWKYSHIYGHVQWTNLQNLLYSLYTVWLLNFSSNFWLLYPFCFDAEYNYWWTWFISSC